MKAIYLFAASGLLLATLSPSVFAQKPTAGKPKAPTATKPGAPGAGANRPVVLGTHQLPGDFGQLGTTYTIGVREPVNVTLKSAEYTTDRFTAGNNVWVPNVNEKLLVLHYTLHNPNPHDLNVSGASLTWTAVDKQDTNHVAVPGSVRDGETEPLSLALKPAQKIDVTSVVVVPAAGVVPKLIMEREAGVPVVRYDLRGKVKPLPAPLADEADTTGATVRSGIPAQPGTFYALGIFDVRLDEVGSTDELILNREAGQGKRWYTTTFTIKNRTSVKQSYVWSDFVPELKDADGEKATWTEAMLKANRNEVTYGDLAPGEEARIRFYFPLPKNVEGKTISLAEAKKVHPSVARPFVFDLTTAPKSPK